MKREVVQLLRQQTPLLSAEEEVSLGRRIQAAIQAGTNDVEAEARFVTSNVRLVVRLARHFRDSPQYGDVVAAGIATLLKYVRTYDPERGHKFSTHAMPGLSRSMTRYLSSYGFTTPYRLPENLVCRAIGRLREGIEDRTMTPAQDIGRELVCRHPRTVTSELEDGEFAARALRFATQRERQVIRLRLGFDAMPDGGPPTLDAIGKILGVVRERVRKIEADGYAKMRAYAQREGLIDVGHETKGRRVC